MFGQYSWWDFIKVVLALAIPYYAYVLWTYYREDIRERIGNRGQSKDAGGRTLATRTRVAVISLIGKRMVRTVFT